MTEACDLTALDARLLIGSGALSPVELFDSCYKRISAINPIINAIVAERFEEARKEAEIAEKSVQSRDELSLLHGLPIGVKDANEVSGLCSTYGSLIYKNNIPIEDEGLVKVIRDSGAIIVGKTNTPEFTAGANTVNAIYGATCNPFDTNLTCGGSSGGTAVALACGMLPLSMGSDIGGSVRIPASFCGVVGHRPTPGLIPYDRRAVAMTPLDVQGPLARNVEDAALLLSALAMPGAKDPMAFPHDPEQLRNLTHVELTSLRIGISADLGCAPISKNIRSIFSKRMADLSSHVVTLKELSLEMATAMEVFWILRGVYFAAAHKKHYENHFDELGPNVRSNYEAALKMTIGDVGWACGQQMKICQYFDSVFDDIDILICPVVGISPFPHVQNFPEEIDGTPLENYIDWVGLTSALSVTGHPITTIPCGVDTSGMPFGIQVIGPKFADRYTLSAAFSLEELFRGDISTARPVPNLDKIIGKN